MAATLPAIDPTGSKVAQGQGPAIQQHRVPSPPSKSKGSSARIVVNMGQAKKRSQGKKEREMEKRRIALRAEQPDLSKREASQYRNTYKHNLCLDMLQAGFHKSFAELFALIQQQNAEREKAGPESTLWNQVLLENETEKLETLKKYLTDAEAAMRAENYAEVYKCQFELALYFQGTKDKWLSDHFFKNCLATSSSVKGDEGKMAAEGHCNVGLALEESGDHVKAAENFELFYQLAKGKSDWMAKDNESTMQTESCSHLSCIYTTIAVEMEMSGELEKYLEFLQKAYDMAKEGGDRKQEGEASYRLGVAFEKNGDSDTALTHLTRYMDVCRSTGDNPGFGKACEALAKSYESQGKVEESIKYLEMFVEVAEKSRDDKAISRACSDLGAMFNSLGRYDQAVDYFNKSYNIARSMNDTETISSSRVLFGVAAAHKMLYHYANHVEISSKPCLERLVEWKDSRGDEFDKPIPEPEPEKEPEPKKEEAKETEQPKEETEETADEQQEGETSDEQKEGETNEGEEKVDEDEKNEEKAE